MWIARRIDTFIRAEPALVAVLALAFLLRIVGIGYGLPLILVNDEAPFTLAALKMLELKTLIPALHAGEFVQILPYPPYLSYLLIVPFVVILGVKLLLFSGPSDLFTAYLVSDLSAFFMTARFLHILLGLASIYLVFKIAEQMFRSHTASLTASFLVATSLLHQSLSMVGRNWLPISFMFVVVLFILTRDLPLYRRYLFAFLAAGISMGFSSISVLAAVLIGLYYITIDLQDKKQLVGDIPRLFLFFVLYVILACIPFLLWGGGNKFIQSITLFQEKTLGGLLRAPWSTLSLTVFSEPVLTLAFLLGLGWLFFEKRRIFFFFALFFLVNALMFYVLYTFHARFLLMILPIYALAAGFFLAQLRTRIPAIVLCVILLVPLIASTRVSYLAYEGDTREEARSWVLQNLPTDARVLVFASGMRIPTTATAVDELRSIDAGALRAADEADERLNRSDVPHVLNNLTSLVQTSFMRDLEHFASAKGYEYLVLEPRSLENDPGGRQAIESMIARGTERAHFSGLGYSMSIWENAFLDPILTLFTKKQFGPDVVIYRLTI